MREIPYEIQDVHGITYPNGVIVVDQVSAQTMSAKNLNMVNNSGVVSYVENNAIATKTLGFRVQLFKNLASLNANKLPIVLKNKAGVDWFTIQMNEMPDSNLDLINFAENYVIENITSELRTTN